MNVPESQQHLLTFKNELSNEHKVLLQNSIDAINIPECENFYNRIANKSSTNLNLSLLTPIQLNKTNDNATQKDYQNWSNLGNQAIRSNKVGVLLLAGGQGTRLGSSKPKGDLSVGSLSNKTLFKIQMQRLLKIQKLVDDGTSDGEKCKIYLYVMTSPATFEAVSEAFKNNQNYGLEDDQVKIFNQGLLPCFSNEGKIILKNKYSVAMAPDGNGGLWKAIRVDKIINDMISKNLESIHMYCVDNVLTKVADPEFIGFCRSKNADCAAKCVTKHQPHEKVGVVCNYNGKPKVVEYSEIDASIAEKIDENDPNELAYRAGNICNHYFSVKFIEKVCSEEFEDQLVHHVAKKKIPFVDLKSGIECKPESNNGIKLEKFVFDVFEFSQNFVLFNEERCNEFSPLKNAESTKSDNARTARSMLHHLHHMWVLKAGGKFKDEAANKITCAKDLNFGETEYPFKVEVSPMTSYKGEGLEFLKGQILDLPFEC